MADLKTLAAIAHSISFLTGKRKMKAYNLSNEDKSLSEDEKRLELLGYKQGLKRTFSALDIFGLVLSNTSVLIGIIPLFGISMYLGGPIALLYGWLITGIFTLCLTDSIVSPKK